ncbi:MFS transporter [Patescibacteria group bacterium]|nr:MFS transporter [Patescibacteria group bacterium]
MNQTKTTFFIQAFYSFISGILIIVLPLLMRERNISIVSIGLIYASLPMVFQLTRMGFALISDFMGRKIFFVFNGILKVFSSAIYYFAYSPLIFLSGKITESVSDACIWSVNRAFILDQEKRKRESLVKLRIFNIIFSALGKLMTGFLIVYFLYTNILIFCAILSIPIILIALTIVERKRGRFRVKEIFDHLDLNKKHVLFKKALFLFLMFGISLGFITGYVFPLFLKEIGFEPKTIGILLGAQMFLMGLSTFYVGKLKGKFLFYWALFYSIVLSLIGLSGTALVGFFVIIFGIANGIVPVFQEDIFYKITRNGTYSTDIGLLTTSLHFGRTISLALSGFIITFYGFGPVFLLSALIFIIFSLYIYNTFIKRTEPAPS